MAKKKTIQRPEGELTIKALADGYLAHLEKSGKSPGTALSYKLELVLAMAELGADTPLASLTPERVSQYFECERVMRTRTGREKAPPTYLKSRRVFRQALQFAEAAKWIDKAPLPSDEQPAAAS